MAETQEKIVGQINTAIENTWQCKSQTATAIKKHMTNWESKGHCNWETHAHRRVKNADR